MCAILQLVSAPSSYPSREILIVDLSFNLVSEIAIKLGISLHMNKISFRYERFLDRLQVLQCSRETPYHLF